MFQIRSFLQASGCSTAGGKGCSLGVWALANDGFPGQVSMFMDAALNPYILFYHIILYYIIVYCIILYCNYIMGEDLVLLF